MKCEHCGGELKQGEEFCEWCGAVSPLYETAGETREEIVPGPRVKETTARQDHRMYSRAHPGLFKALSNSKNEDVRTLTKIVKWAIGLDLVCIASMVTLVAYPVLLIASLCMHLVIRQGMKGLGLWKASAWDVRGEGRLVVILYNKYIPFFLSSLFPVILALGAAAIFAAVCIYALIFE